MAALLLVGSLSIWAEATASQASVASDMSAGAARTEQATKPLSSLLNADGTLNLNLGFSGSLDTAGWQMVSAVGEPPRFVPAASGGSPQTGEQPNAGEPAVAGDENWQGGFGEGTNSSVSAESSEESGASGCFAVLRV